MRNEPDHPRTPRPDRRALLEINAESDADDAIDFTSAVIRALARACEERGWHIEVRALDEHADLGGVRRAVLAIDGSTGEVAAGSYEPPFVNSREKE